MQAVPTAKSPGNSVGNFSVLFGVAPFLHSWGHRVVQCLQGCLDVGWIRSNAQLSENFASVCGWSFISLCFRRSREGLEAHFTRLLG